MGQTNLQHLNNIDTIAENVNKPKYSTNRAQFVYNHAVATDYLVSKLIFKTLSLLEM